MDFIDKITGNDMRRTMKVFQSRINQLPVDYQDAWELIKIESWAYSDLSGRNLIPILESILEFLEEAALDFLTIDKVCGGDYNKFVQELSRDNYSKCYRDKWRKKLNNKVEKKLSNLQEKTNGFT